MAEKNILAYFKSYGAAEKTAEQLKQRVGVVDLRIDQVSLFPGEGVEKVTDPASGDISSLSELTLGADRNGKDTGILLSASNSASGMSGELDDAMTRNYLLTAVVKESDHEEALDIVERMGGLL